MQCRGKDAIVIISIRVGNTLLSADFDIYLLQTLVVSGYPALYVNGMVGNVNPMELTPSGGRHFLGCKSVGNDIGLVVLQSFESRKEVADYVEIRNKTVTVKITNGTFWIAR